LLTEYIYIVIILYCNIVIVSSSSYRGEPQGWPSPSPDLTRF